MPRTIKIALPVHRAGRVTLVGERGSRSVWISATYPTLPVMHRIGSWSQAAGIATECGKPMGYFGGTPTHWCEKGTWIPLKHAARFARPCRRCPWGTP